MPTISSLKEPPRLARRALGTIDNRTNHTELQIYIHPTIRIYKYVLFSQCSKSDYSRQGGIGKSSWISRSRRNGSDSTGCPTNSSHDTPKTNSLLLYTLRPQKRRRGTTAPTNHDRVRKWSRLYRSLGIIP